jgi:gamma-glutamyl-gamma-aminobutyrate hydrolase PuuD
VTDWVVLTQRIIRADNGELRDCLDQRWARLFETWQLLVVPLPTTTADVYRYLDSVRPVTVVLTGGNDLLVLPNPMDPTPARDRLEHHVIDWCTSRRVPLVGVCRGMQLLAHAHGAVLSRVPNHVAVRHRVLVQNGPGGVQGWREVNSFHSGSVPGENVPPVLRPWAWDETGNVEAFVHRQLPQAGVMWHPERETDLMAWTVTSFRSLVAGGET